MKLTAPQAEEFARIVLSGVPTSRAVYYFLPAECTKDDAEEAAKEWYAQKEVQDSLQRLTGGVPWQRLDRNERLTLALDKHYAELAYFLWSNNYSELDGAGKQKADTCRQALESKVAGTAGKGNAMERFYEDLLTQYKRGGIPKVGLA
jgi:hypothetical protein